MTFTIRMGIPEMDAFYRDLDERAETGTLDKNEKRFFKKFLKAIKHLSTNPRHPGLQSHEIEPLSRKYNRKIFQSYIDQSDTADRLFWTYGPGRKEITVLGVEPHPESRKREAYQRIRLSQMPPRGD